MGRDQVFDLDRRIVRAADKQRGIDLSHRDPMLLILLGAIDPLTKEKQRILEGEADCLKSQLALNQLTNAGSSGLTSTVVAMASRVRQTSASSSTTPKKDGSEALARARQILRRAS